MWGYRKIKKRLLSRKQDLERKLKSDMETAAELGSVSDIAAGELSAYDNHPAESATQLYDREKDLAFHKLEQNELEEINHALEKMRDGNYGYDEKTGEKIPRARLNALPTARTVVCQSETVHHYNLRPVEESVIIDSEEQGVTDFESDGFNEQNAFDLVSQYNDQEGIYEDAPYSDDEEGIGFVEEYEAFAATNIGGFSGDDKIQVLKNHHYDHWSAKNEDDYLNPIER
jgi:YteA family regulatory protein